MVLHQKPSMLTFKLLCVTLSVIYRVELYRFIILNFEEIEQATEHENEKSLTMRIPISSVDVMLMPL